MVRLAMTVHLEFLLAIEGVLCTTLPGMANITHVLILFQNTNTQGMVLVSFVRFERGLESK